MTNNRQQMYQNPLRPLAIDAWRYFVTKSSVTPSPWNAETDEKKVMQHWVFETLYGLRWNRNVDVDRDSVRYFWRKLQTMNYTPDIAENAQLWMEIGDWSHKGNNPKVELSDFFPTADQIKSVRERINRSSACDKSYESELLDALIEADELIGIEPFEHTSQEALNSHRKIRDAIAKGKLRNNKKD